MQGFIKETMNTVVDVTTERVQAKAREVARQHSLPANVFKVSRNWLQLLTKRLACSLRWGTSVPQHFEEKLQSFQQYPIDLQGHRGHSLSQIRNANEVLIYIVWPLPHRILKSGMMEVKTQATRKAKQGNNGAGAHSVVKKALFMCCGEHVDPAQVESFSSRCELLVPQNGLGWAGEALFAVPRLSKRCW